MLQNIKIAKKDNSEGFLRNPLSLPTASLQSEGFLRNP